MYPIMLDKERNLKYGMVALDIFEKKTLRRISTKSSLKSLSIEEIATLLWAGLQHEDKTLTVKKTMELVDKYSDISTVFLEVGKAVEDAFGGDGSERSEDEENESDDDEEDGFEEKND